MQLPVRAGKRDGPDARYLSALIIALDGGRRSQSRYGAAADENRLYLREKGQSGVNFDWVELGNSGAYWMRLSIPYKKRFGPGGHFWIVGMVVPEDNDNCRVFFWRIRGVQGWQRDLWRFMYRNRLEKLHWEVLEQDRVVLESTAPNARDHEYLYQHDVGLSRLRRMMQKAAKEQLAPAKRSRVPPDERPANR